MGSPVKLAWGFGGSAMQMEGAWNVDGKGPSVFDNAYLSNQSLTATGGQGTPFRASDHYNRVKEDIGYLSSLGATAYRFSVAWSRILPNCTGEINQKGVDFYSDYIDQIRAAGAEPFLTMFHWDLPQACQDRFNGWQSPQVIDAFVNYADILLDKFGSKVNYWLTLNEPRANCDFCMRKAQFAPFTVTDMQTYFNCVHNSLLAHGMVVQNARKKYNNPNWKFSIPNIMEWHDPDPGSDPTNENADENSSTIRQAEWYFDPCVTGDYGPGIKRRHPEIPSFTEEQKAMMKGTCDYIAVNIYSSFSAANPNAEPPGETSPYDKQEVVDPTALTYWPHPRPEGVIALPKSLYDRYRPTNPAIEMVIAEIGYHVPREFESNLAQVVKDDLRVQFWRLNAPALVKLATEIPLKAILAWSLLDNYEFYSYEFRWGHIAVDYFGDDGKVNTDKGSLNRTVKDSAKWMSEYFKKEVVSPFPKYTGGNNSTSSTTSSQSRSVAVGMGAGFLVCVLSLFV